MKSIRFNIFLILQYIYNCPIVYYYEFNGYAGCYSHFFHFISLKAITCITFQMSKSNEAICLNFKIKSFLFFFYFFRQRFKNCKQILKVSRHRVRNRTPACNSTLSALELNIFFKEKLNQLVEVLQTYDIYDLFYMVYIYLLPIITEYFNIYKSLMFLIFYDINFHMF